MKDAHRNRAFKKSYAANWMPASGIHFSALIGSPLYSPAIPYAMETQQETLVETIENVTPHSTASIVPAYLSLQYLHNAVPHPFVQLFLSVHAIRLCQ